jgi:hypothetical protein
MTTTHHVETPAGGDKREDLGSRLDGIGWGLLLIMTGAIWLVPEEQIPQGTWLVGTGLLLLALNGYRYLKGIDVSAFTTFLGALALAAGLGDYLGVQLPLLAILFIVIGASIIVKPLMSHAR